MQLHSIIRKSIITACLAFLCGSAEAKADDHGGTFATASSITAENPASRDFAGNLETAGDVDMFSFTVTEETMLWLYTTGTTDTHITLYNAAGSEMDYANNGGAGYNPSIFRTGSDKLIPGTYRIAVNAGGYTSQPQTGAYTLSIRTQANASTFNTPNLAASLSVAGEIDLFQVEITEETMLWLYTTGITDTYFILYNSVGSEIDYANNGGADYNPYIVRTGAYKLLPGTYFIAVEAGGYSSQPQTGAYTLSIRTQTNAAEFNTPNLTASLAVPGEVDLFRLVITEETMLWLYTTGITDTYFVLYNSVGSEIDYANNGGAGYNPSIFRTGADKLLPGTYFIAVEAGGYSGQPQTGTYTLSIRTKTNATAFNAANLDRSLGVAGDIDLYRINVTKPGRGFFLTTGKTDTNIEVYDANGTYITSDNNNGSTYNAYLGLFLSTGTYYVTVSAGGYTSQPQTGAYRFSVRLPGNATALTGNSKVARSISPRGDIDHFVFTTRGGKVDLKSTGMTDTTAYLFRANGQFVISDDNSGYGNGNFRILTTLPRGTYYLVVTGSSLDTVTGRYSLLSKFPSAPVTVPAVDSWAAGFLAQSFSIGIRSNTKWTVSEKASWLKVSPKTGKGNSNIKLTVTRNPGAARTATVTVGGKKIVVRQRAGSAASPSDWNGDGSPDLLATNAATGETATWQIEGGNLVAATISPASRTSWQLVNQGDFTGDATPDTVWQNPTSGDIAIRDGGSSGEMIPLDRQPGNTRWQVVATGNFGDTKALEIILQNRDSGTLRLWKIDRDLHVTATRALSHQPASAAWQVVAAGDADGDGHTDLFFRHRDGQLHLWFMDGRKVIASGALTHQPAKGTWIPCGSADFNGDGKSDLIVQHAKTGQVMIWHLDGRVVTGVRELGKQPVGIAWEISNSRPR